MIGFTVGALFPGRFTAPLAAIGTFLLAEIGFHAALQVKPNGSTYGLLSTATAVPLGDDGVFYHVAQDLAIAQVMFMGGITVALLGVLALAPVFRLSYRGLLSAVSRTGRWLCVAGIALLAAGVASAATALRADRHHEAERVRLGHPGAARRRERPADSVHPGLRGHLVQGVRAPGVRRVP